MKNSKYWFIKLSNDEYELPMAVAESVIELSKMTGINVQMIYKGIRNRERGIPYSDRTRNRFCKVLKEDADIENRNDRC